MKYEMIQMSEASHRETISRSKAGSSIRRASLSFAALISLGMISHVQSAVVVQWGGDMVSGTEGLILPTPTTNGSTRTWGYGSSAPLLSPAANYSGQAIYGALQNTPGSGVAANLGSARIENVASVDELRIWGSTPSAGQTSTVNAFIFFTPNVASTDTVTFTAGNSALSATVSLPSAASRETRFAVQSGGVWYLSQTVATTSTSLFTLDDASIALWGVWDPTGAPLSAVPTSFTTLGSAFTDIEAIGFYSIATRSDGNGARITATNFTANATVVPEPASIALLLLGGGLVFYVRRASNRRCAEI